MLRTLWVTTFGRGGSECGTNRRASQRSLSPFGGQVEVASNVNGWTQVWKQSGERQGPLVLSKTGTRECPRCESRPGHHFSSWLRRDRIADWLVLLVDRFRDRWRPLRDRLGLLLRLLFLGRELGSLVLFPRGFVSHVSAPAAREIGVATETNARIDRWRAP